MRFDHLLVKVDQLNSARGAETGVFAPLVCFGMEVAVMLVSQLCGRKGNYDGD